MAAVTDGSSALFVEANEKEPYFTTNKSKAHLDTMPKGHSPGCQRQNPPTGNPALFPNLKRRMASLFSSLGLAFLGDLVRR